MLKMAKKLNARKTAEKASEPKKQTAKTEPSEKITESAQNQGGQNTEIAESSEEYIESIKEKIEEIKNEGYPYYEEIESGHVFARFQLLAESYKNSFDYNAFFSEATADELKIILELVKAKGDWFGEEYQNIVLMIQQYIRLNDKKIAGVSIQGFIKSHQNLNQKIKIGDGSNLFFDKPGAMLTGCTQLEQIKRVKKTLEKTKKS